MNPYAKQTKMGRHIQPFGLYSLLQNVGIGCENVRAQDGFQCGSMKHRTCLNSALPDLKVIDQTESKNAFWATNSLRLKWLATFCPSVNGIQICPSQSNRKHRYVVCDYAIRYKSLHCSLDIYLQPWCSFHDETLRAWNSSKDIHKTSIKIGSSTAP